MKLYLVYVGYYDVYPFFANDKEDLINLIKASSYASKMIDIHEELSTDVSVYEYAIKRGVGKEGKRIH